VSRSHPFIERLIGAVRRECLDQTLFWNSHDLQRKLDAFKAYYNGFRVHASLDGETPLHSIGEPKLGKANIYDFGWQTHCSGLFQTPIAS